MLAAQTNSPTFNTPGRIESSICHIFPTNIHQQVVLSDVATCDVAAGPLKRGLKIHTSYSLNGYSHCFSLFWLFFYLCLCLGMHPQLELAVDVKESPKSQLPNSPNGKFLILRFLLCQIEREIWNFVSNHNSLDSKQIQLIAVFSLMQPLGIFLSLRLDQF